MQFPGNNTNLGVLPRMIPVFACCAMQSSYALIMLSYKTKAMGFAGSLGVGDNREEQALKLLGQLSDGLQMILGAVKNYSIAYEALGGMTDQIEAAAQSINVMPENGIHGFGFA